MAMRKKRNTLRLIGLVLVALFVNAYPAKAQAVLDEPPPSSCLPTDPDYDPRICVPIDGGLAILLLAGIGYGVRKYKVDASSQKNLDSSAE